MLTSAKARQTTVAVVQEGDDSRPQFAISPDGKWVVSSSSTRRKLWNKKGELQRDLEPPIFGGSTPVFFPDSRRFCLTDDGGSAIYALPSGRKIRDVNGAQLSADTRFFIRRTDKTLSFSDAQSGKQLATVTAHPAISWNETLNFSPNGLYVAASQTASAYSDGKMRIWNIRTGKLVRTLSDPRGGFGKDNGVVGPALWSNDGKILVTGGEDPNWRVPPDDGGPHTEAFYFHSYAIKIWDVKSGRLLHVWPGYGTNEDGVSLREFVSPHEVSFRDDYRVLDIYTGKVRKDTKEPVSKAKQIVYLDNRTGYFELRDSTGTKTLRGFPVCGFAGYEHLAYSPDGSLLAAADNNDGSVQIYDAKSGVLMHTLSLYTPTGSEAVDSLHWLSDGSISASSLQSAWIWTRGGKLARHFAPPISPGRDVYHDGVSVSPDRSLFLSSGDECSSEKRRMVHVWHGDGTLLRDILDFGASTSSASEYDIWIDSSRLALPSIEGVEIWDLKVGTRQASLKKASTFERLSPVVASPDGHFLLCREEKKENDVLLPRTVLLETKNWQRVRVYEGCSPLAWNSDSTKFAASGAKGTLIFSTQSSQPLRQMPFTAAVHYSFAFSPDLRFAAISNNIYSATHSEIWRVDTNEIVASLYLFGEGKAAGAYGAKRFWLALIPSGFYDGAKGIEKWLRWRRNDVLLPVGALRKERWSPQKVRASLR